MVDDYPKNYPECVEGKGNPPPEDTGGEWGYDDFYEAINDLEHPEHEELVTWGRSQDY